MSFSCQEQTKDKLGITSITTSEKENKMAYIRTREGPRILTTMIDDLWESRFSEIDNLDSKKLPDATNEYEKVFIVVRSALEKNESFCLDNEQWF